MITRILLVISLAAAVASCGVKDNLLTPDGKQTPKGEHDPSRPPQPIGR